MLEFPFTDRVPGFGDLADGGHELPVDISGEPGRVEYRYWLGRTDGEVWMAARAEKKAIVHPDVSPGAWHAGLWYYDCAELFLACTATGRYLEVNLAPNGAYWVGVFSAPRRQDETTNPEVWPISTGGAILPGKWTASISLPWTEVVGALGGEPDRGNVTAVLGGCPDDNPPLENLRSVAKMDSTAPDFHSPDRFVPASWP